MRVAYITGRGAKLPSGRKQASGIDSNKAWIWNEAGESVGYLAVPDKKKNNPPHTGDK
jgi:hypothetical protein